jgi:ribonuclease D
MASLTKKYKLSNPYKPDEQIIQEVVVSDEPVYDYSKSKWVAIDTEFINLNFENSLLCVIQIASPDPENEERQRVEVLFVRDKVRSGEDKSLREHINKILSNKDVEVLMHVSTADLPRVEKFANTELAGTLYDTKVAAKMVMYSEKNGLDDLVATLIDPRFSKDKLVTMSQWDLPFEEWSDKMVEYAMRDVIYLHPLQIYLNELADRRDMGQLVEQIMQALPAVTRLYKHGLSVNALTY